MGQGYTRVWALISLYTFCDRSRVWIVRADVRTPTATFSTVSEWEEYEGGADGQF